MDLVFAHRNNIHRKRNKTFYSPLSASRLKQRNALEISQIRDDNNFDE